MGDQIQRKPESSETQGSQHVRFERQANPRYRLSPPPEVEILQPDKRTPVRVSLRDISRGGCYIETKCELPLETEVTVTLKRNGDRIRAQARVVRVGPPEGLALQFTSMEAEEFRRLETWLSTYLKANWAAANRRKGHRLAMQIKVKVSGYNGEGARFAEDTITTVINPYGCLVSLRTAVKKGQRLVLSSAQTKKAVECYVVHHEVENKESRVGLAFTVPNQPFWPVDFPSTERAPHFPDQK